MGWFYGIEEWIVHQLQQMVECLGCCEEQCLGSLAEAFDNNRVHVLASNLHDLKVKLMD